MNLLRGLNRVLNKLGWELQRKEPPKPPLFDPAQSYPSDAIGPYIDLEGEIVAVSREHAFANRPGIRVDIKTNRGVFTGWYGGEFPPLVGYRGRIRLYRHHGAWHPHHIVMCYWKTASGERF